MRRSTVLNLPPQFEFPGQYNTIFAIFSISVPVEAGGLEPLTLRCWGEGTTTVPPTDLYCESRLDKNLWAELAVLLLNSCETAKNVLELSLI